MQPKIKQAFQAAINLQENFESSLKGLIDVGAVIGEQDSTIHTKLLTASMNLTNLLVLGSRFRGILDRANIADNNLALQQERGIIDNDLNAMKKKANVLMDKEFQKTLAQLPENIADSIKIIVDAFNELDNTQQNLIKIDYKCPDFEANAELLKSSKMLAEYERNIAAVKSLGKLGDTPPPPPM